MRTMPKVGDKVTCNGGFPGTVTRICEWTTAMVEIRLASGTVCIDICDCEPLVVAPPPR